MSLAEIDDQEGQRKTYQHFQSCGRRVQRSYFAGGLRLEIGDQERCSS